MSGVYLTCKECGTPVRWNWGVGIGAMWPMHPFCAQDRQDEEGAGAHAVAARLNEIRYENEATP